MPGRSSLSEEQFPDRSERQRLPHGLGTLDEEAPGPLAVSPSQQPTRCADPGGPLGAQTAPGSLLGWMCSAQAASPSCGVGALAPRLAGRCALATSTRAVNAVGSETASSARFLRSTSTSAIRRPWMSRL